MGAGIAQTTALGGYQTVLYEVDEQALERCLGKLRGDLRRGAERQRWSDSDVAEAEARLESGTRIEVLAGCQLVIEAAPEDLELKRDLFGRLAAVCGPEAVLAT